jgi:hypothetical protein
VRRQRVIDASIDKSTYQEQVDLLNEEITLTELEIYDTKLEELDLEAALNFAVSALTFHRAKIITIHLSDTYCVLNRKLIWPIGIAEVASGMMVA